MITVFSYKKMQEEKLHLLRDYFKAATRAKLAEEHFWNTGTMHRYGVGPAEVDPKLMELRHLTSVGYAPNLDQNPDNRDICYVLLVLL